MAGLWKRQAPLDSNSSDSDYDDAYDNGNGYGGYDGETSWWWTPAGMATRYAIVAILFAFILFFFVGGYYHARSRVNNGQQLLPYHRWMVRRSYYQPAQPRYPFRQDQYNQQSYGMEGYPPPPPAYSNEEAPPPVYQPPQGATKAMADQSFGGTNRIGEGSGSGGISAPAISARQ
ncbi:hypothetical protein LTR37_007623 [Vermiconidia calcicola]|uniref:Uncharacterized protein n=1 Tax=Vermiconidia calcicola TaxID=1690605 RepID=A0ACC3NDW7_9PEZI|nr:hypothetical protein LTR37_007623 [Vermiconidia calcicola]